MRTTLTLDPDVDQRLKQETRRTGKSLKAAVNDALRAGLGIGGSPAKAARFVVKPHAFGFKPGVDLDRLNQLVDEMDVAAGARETSTVILPDINLLLHAHNSESPAYAEARKWWEDLLNGTRPVGLAWVVMLGFIRITTHRQILERPWTTVVACARVREWLDRPCVSVVHPGDRHASVLFSLLETLGTAANLTTDAHLAALAIEYQAELHSTDADFHRFPGLRWTNPIH